MSSSTATVTRSVEGTELPAAGTYAVDASHTHVGFSVRHAMVSRTKGRFADVAGEIVIAEDPVESSVEVTIGTGSIDTRDERRDEHLRSPDFLDTEAHPTMHYRSRSVRPAGEGRWIVEGDLSVRGVTRPLALAVAFEGGAKDPWGGERIGFTADAELDREDFGLTWNQVLETGGVLVGKKVRIELEAEAVRH